MKVRPLADRVLIRPLSETEAKVGSIIIPDTAKEKPQEGEIVAVGGGKTSDEGVRVEIELSVGDRVLYGKYSGTEVHLDDEDLLIVRENDVLAVISN
ncbi:MAG: co-chaperone GroES [Gemmatimonadetes bacterium]|nr:co-chaperone GroES [Gemmatimonadota bacterium]